DGRGAERAAEQVGELLAPHHFVEEARRAGGHEARRGPPRDHGCARYRGGTHAAAVYTPPAPATRTVIPHGSLAKSAPSPRMTVAPSAARRCASAARASPPGTTSVHASRPASSGPAGGRPAAHVLRPT